MEGTVLILRRPPLVHAYCSVPKILGILLVPDQILLLIRNAIATSTRFLPSESILKACDSFDFGSVSICSPSVIYPFSLSTLDFNLFIIAPMSRKDICISLAISLIDLFSLYSRITYSSFSSLLISNSQAKKLHDYIRDWSLIALSLFLLFPPVTIIVATDTFTFPSVFNCYPLLPEVLNCARTIHHC